MRWETRIHWIWGFLAPSQWYLVALSMGMSLGILTLKWSGWLTVAILLVFGAIGLMGLLDVWIKWMSFSFSVSPTGKAFLEHHGFRIIAERRINWNMIGTWTFKQTPMGRILDYGTLSIGALGGPYEYENLGQFRALRRIIETQGEWIPNSRPNMLVIVRNWISLITLRVLRSLRNIWQAISLYLQQLYTEFVDSQKMPNYTRFLQFAKMVLFDQNTRRYESTVRFESVSGSTFTHAEIRFYNRILRERKVIIKNLRGLEQRHHRIQTLDDLRRHIPADWFYKTLKTT